MKTYKVTLEPIEDGYWLATVPSVQGCLTQAPTISKVKRRIRDALSLFVKDAETAELKFDVKLPKDFLKELEQFEVAAREARNAGAMYQKFAERLSRRAHKELRLSVRETAELMGVSPQRAHQWAARPGKKASNG